MLSTPTFIPKEIADKIKETAQLQEVIQDFTELKRSGSSMVGNCPYCHAKKFTVTVTNSKQIYKCFSGCEKGGNHAVQFLTDVMGKTYPEALHYLADRYNIAIETEDQSKTKNKKGNRKEKFRDRQLRESGIPVKEQKWMMAENATTKVEADRYQAASVNTKFWTVVPGDDMVLHYLDLAGKPITYKTSQSKSQPLVRVRWANPSLHLDRNGKPVKYKSPWNSGSHLWIPNWIIKAYQQEQILETLYICEGEKKADKMCLEGLPAVGVMGIHNFATADTMPVHFEQLIKKCSVSRVVFVLDSDWQEISIKEGKSADERPRLFFKAVMRFRDYFYAYSNSGIYLDIYFAHGKDTALKGIDDLLVRGLKDKESELKEDFERTLVSRDGQGTYVNAYKITEISAYKLKEFWYLHSNPAFMQHHKDELKKLREFRVGQLKWRYNEEEDQFELAQKLLPHEQYWTKDEWEDRSGKTRTKYSFNYTNCRYFLRNRGFGLYEYQPDQYRFVHVENKIVRETSSNRIRRYVMEFTEEIEEKNVLELLLRGGKQYLGPDKLGDMYPKDLRFMESEKECMYLFFQSKYWKITRDEITERPLSELPYYVWKDKLIAGDPELHKEPMVQVEYRNDHWKLKMTDAGRQCDMVNFYNNTSMFHWRKYYQLVEEEGKKFYVPKAKPEEATEAEIKLHRAHLVTKMIAAGYIMHDYLDYSNMKAIVCMDGVESEVGKSEGGTGKSLWSEQFNQLVPAEIIDGKKQNLETDNHVYELVDERTHLIIFDDVRVNFPFEWLFSQITRGIEVNPKGEKRTKLSPPKFIINTNHAINGDGNSFRRRQYPIAFSDYYNGHRTIADEFGYQLFHEWEQDQWDLFYNFIANCIQIYLRYGLEYRIPEEDIERRRMRQHMGEKFLDWAQLAFDEEIDHTGAPVGVFLNKKIERNYLYTKYLEQYPSDRKWTDNKRFKEKLQIYCQYAGLHFNPTAGGDRLRSNGKEYFIIANKDFDASRMGRNNINSDEDLSKGNLPF